MRNLYLIASLAGQRVALDATSIDSVVNVGVITPAPLAPPHIAGLAALRSRVITMIDCRIALGLAVAPHAASMRAIVVNLDGHQYGLVVDQVDDVCTIEGGIVPVRARLGQGWGRAALGMLDHEGGSLLLLDPAMLIAGSQDLAA